MDKLTELADLDAKLGALNNELRDTNSSDLAKISQIQAKTSVLQKRKNELLGISDK
jgi:hypothetical protein